MYLKKIILAAGGEWIEGEPNEEAKAVHMRTETVVSRDGNKQVNTYE